MLSTHVLSPNMLFIDRAPVIAMDLTPAFSVKVLRRNQPPNCALTPNTTMTSAGMSSRVAVPVAKAGYPRSGIDAGAKPSSPFNNSRASVQEAACSENADGHADSTISRPHATDISITQHKNSPVQKLKEYARRAANGAKDACSKARAAYTGVIESVKPYYQRIKTFYKKWAPWAMEKAQAAADILEKEWEAAKPYATPLADAACAHAQEALEYVQSEAFWNGVGQVQRAVVILAFRVIWWIVKVLWASTKVLVGYMLSEYFARRSSSGRMDSSKIA